MSELSGQALFELSVFAGLHEDPVFAAFAQMLEAAQTGPARQVRQAAAAFAARLYKAGTQDWSGYLKELVLQADTCLAVQSGLHQEVPKLMLEAAMQELEILSKACGFSCEDLHAGGHLAMWQAQEEDLQAAYLNRLLEIHQYGYGVFAEAKVFRLEERDHQPFLAPVKHPDPVTFAMLHDYDEQHETVLANTRALLEGKPAANVLLYGDAGTGKSATVKAAVNALAFRGLRLIEAGKKQLHLLPQLLDLLCAMPLKFILFIDDLSFMENDDEFSELKAVLEGSAAARAANTVIYATSNRRHLVKESMDARAGDDVHRSDTMQETISLSERFGLKVYFQKPNKEEYLDIVHALAQQAGLRTDQALLDKGAEEYALRKSGRSARAARQYVESLAANAKEGAVC